MGTFKQAIYDNYLTSNGAIHTMRNPDNQITSGNHHVINATFYTIQEKMTGFSQADVDLAKGFIESTRDPSGVFNRAPEKLEDQAHDDLIAIATTSVILNLPYAQEIYEQGNKWKFPKLFGLIPIPTKWYYDNTEETPNFHPKHVMWRFPWAVAVFKKSVGKELSSWDKFWYNKYVANVDKDTNATSGRILRWLTTRVMKTEMDCLDSIRKFNRSVQVDYPRAMSDVMGIYHGFEHPFSEMTQSMEILQ